MTLLYMQEYIDRHLYVLEHEGKYLQVYRSSGHSGTGHGGMLIPFSGIDEGRGLRSHPGYIFKEMFYDGRWVHHRKEIQYYENVTENMDVIEDFLGGREPKKDVSIESFFTEDGKEFKDYRGFLEYIAQTRAMLEEVRGNLQPFDLLNLITKEGKQ